MALPQRDRIGPYELLLLLARGGMAELYLGRLRGYAGADRLVAIKVILPHLASDKTFTEMFINEGRIAARLSHPNICHVTELRKDGDDLALAMEYLEGVGWDALVAAAPRDPRLVAGVLAQACEGLHHAHTLQDLDGTPTPVVHRDVSPQNLFVTVAGTVKVLDFGVSKIASDRNRTRTGVLKGKLPYMAPEQIEGTAVDARADIWALGVILWEALTGRRLFDRDSDFQIWKAITEEPIPPTGHPALDRVLARAVARDREQRYPTALELARDLEAAGACRHAEIADAVRAHCGDALAELKRKIEVAVKGRSEPTPEASLGDSQAAAETVSMLMRKDSVVVAHPRRRWWPAALGALAVATVAVIAVAMRSGDAAGPTVATTTTAGATTASGNPSNATTPGPTMQPGTTGPRTTAGGTTPNATTTPGPTTTLGATTTRSTTSGTTTRRGPTTTLGATTTRSTTSGTTTRPGVPGATTTRSTTSGTTTRPGVPGATTPPPATTTGATTARGTYAVDSTPYATIYIDGALIGDTPLDRVALSPGAHTVKAVLADGRRKSFAIEIAADRKTTSGMLSW